MGYKKSIGIYFEKTIGDLIYTSSIVGSIRKNEPEAHIHVVTSDLGLQILDVENPDYDKISKKFDNLINYDTIYYPLRCLQNVPYWFVHKKHVRDLAAESIGIKVSSTKSNVINPEDKNVSNECIKIKNSRYIIINNRASSDRLKEVPQEIINQVSMKISEDIKIYQIGLSQDPPINSADQILMGKLSIVDSLYLIKHAYMVIGIDNFCLHAAGVYGTPMIGMYGQYDAKQVEPIDFSNNKKVINKGIFGSYNTKGLSEITVEEIYDNYQKLRGEL